MISGIIRRYLSPWEVNNSYCWGSNGQQQSRKDTNVDKFEEKPRIKAIYMVGGRKDSISPTQPKKDLDW